MPRQETKEPTRTDDGQVNPVGKAHGKESTQNAQVTATATATGGDRTMVVARLQAELAATRAENEALRKTTEDAQRDHLSVLSTDVLAMIAAHLRLQDIARTQRTCKKLFAQFWDHQKMICIEAHEKKAAGQLQTLTRVQARNPLQILIISGRNEGYQEYFASRMPTYFVDHLSSVVAQAGYFSSLPTRYGHCPRIKQLNLMAGGGINITPEYGLSALESLKITGGGDDSDDVLRGICALPALQELVIHHNSIGGNWLEQIPTLFPLLKSFHVGNYTRLSSISQKSVAKSLRNLSLTVYPTNGAALDLDPIRHASVVFPNIEQMVIKCEKRNVRFADVSAVLTGLFPRLRAVTFNDAHYAVGT